MHSVGFEPAIPEIEKSQTYSLDRTATVVGFCRHDSTIFHLAVHNWCGHIIQNCKETRKAAGRNLPISVSVTEFILLFIISAGRATTLTHNAWSKSKVESCRPVYPMKIYRGVVV
jgi:hypothetical protein